jgi:hypothetical protein
VQTPYILVLVPREPSAVDNQADVDAHLSEDGEEGIENIPWLDFLADDRIQEPEVNEVLLKTFVLEIREVAEQNQ